MKRTTPKRRRPTTSSPFPTFFWLGGIILILALALIMYASLAPRPADRQTADAAVIQTGAQVYQQQCAACHGENLEGQPDWQQPFPNGLFKAPPHDETGHTWHHDDAYLIERTKRGAAALPVDMQSLSSMPAYEEILTDAEINAVITYIKSSWPPQIQEAQRGR